MTPREQFLVDLLTWAAIVYAVCKLAAGAARALASAAEQYRRTRAVLANPRRYCLAGHVHANPDDASHCEAAHGYGDL